MILKSEISIIKFLQKYFYTEEYNILDKTAKVITSRTYRKKYLVLYLLFLIFIQDFYRILYIPKIYLFGFMSRTINLTIKRIFKRQRPYRVDSSILINEKTAKKKWDTYSLPSNSIQTSLIFYKVLLDSMPNINLTLSSILLIIILLITSSAKIIRGLHFPTDIILSVLIFFIVDYIYVITVITLLNFI